MGIEMSERAIRLAKLDASVQRRAFIGGSDARIIMGNDEEALLGLWREKRGEAEPPDYSDNLIVQLGVATEPLNRRWFERTTGQVIKDVQSWNRLDYICCSCGASQEGRAVHHCLRNVGRDCRSPGRSLSSDSILRRSWYSRP